MSQSANEAVEQLIAQIRAACAPGAAPETRAHAAAACRVILTALEGQPSPGLAGAAAAPSSGSSPATAALGTLVDMVYEKLRPHLEALPQGALPALEPIPFVTMPVPWR